MTERLDSRDVLALIVAERLLRCREVDSTGDSLCPPLVSFAVPGPSTAVVVTKGDDEVR